MIKILSLIFLIMLIGVASASDGVVSGIVVFSLGNGVNVSINGNQSFTNITAWGNSVTPANTFEITVDNTTQRFIPTNSIILCSDNCSDMPVPSTSLSTSPAISFSWNQTVVATPYNYQLARDIAFLSAFFSGSLGGSPYYTTGQTSLDFNETYFWRIKNSTSTYAENRIWEFKTPSAPALVPGSLNVTVLDERNLTIVSNYTATIYNNTYSYSNSTTNGYVNFSSSEISSGEYLLTITPNSTYAARSILITSPTNAIVYVPSTGFTIDSVSFYLLDYTGNFNYPDTVFSIYRNNSVMHSSYFDADAKVSTNLIDGDSYFITVQSGNYLYNWGNYVPAGSGNVQITITNIGVNKSDLLPFNFNTSYNNNSINLAWTGNSGELVLLNYTILKGTSKTLVHQVLTTVPNGESAYIVTNTSEVYYVFVTANTRHGYMNNSFAIDYSRGIATGAVGLAMIPATMFKWGSYQLDAGMRNNAAILILILLTGSFGALFAGLGAIISALFSVLFAYWGWLSYTGAGIGFFGGLLFYAILYFMQDKGRKT